jgi:hypothetical protein
LIKGFIEFLKIIRTRVACIVIDEAEFVLSFPGQGQAGTDEEHTDIDPINKKKSGVKFLDCYSIPGPSRPSSHLKSESKTERTPKACRTQLVTLG